MSAMVDRISSLPDALLCHILSFLPTIEAVCTSVLSKRWKPLWLFVFTLHFNDKNYLHNNDTYFRFLESVYTVMLRRNLTQTIQRFDLECVSSHCKTSTVHTWVMAAIQHKVEHLALTLHSTVHLPCCIVTSTTLVVLKLTGLTVNSVSSVSFPSLKTLHLTRVRFLEKSYVFEILSACPVLEDLFTNFLKYFNFYPNGQLKRLPKLVKADIFGDIPVASFCNVEFLRIQVVLWTTIDEIQTFVNLTYMELIFDSLRWNWLIKLLRHSPNLQILVVDKGNLYSTGNGDEDWVHPKLVPECLSSKLKKCFVRKYDGGRDELEFARYIMRNAKVLHTLTITSNSSTIPEEKLEIIKKLSSCQRISVECELFFE